MFVPIAVSYYRAVVQTLSDLHVSIVHVPLMGKSGHGGAVNLTQIFHSVATSSSVTITVRHVILCVSPFLVNAVLEEVTIFC